MFGFWRRKAANSGRRPGFLSRLARDSRGNTLAIVGAALVPLTAMIGSGVDMSRAYMAKTRLQMACDASALAARRIMQNDTLDSTVTAEGVRFFNYNFNQGMYGTAAFTPSITRPSQGTIRVSASTTIPTTIMRMFGFSTLPLSVTCDANLNFVNTDVMLVLDTTGSMDNDVNDDPTSNDADRKITALRAAVMALYDQLKPVQDQLAANGLRLRYGVVPYSSSVNVGSLIRAVDPTYLRTSTPYQTRVANYTNYGTNTNSDTTVTETYSLSITQTECNSYAANAGYPILNGQPASTGGPSPAPVTQITYSLRDWGGSGTADTSGTTRTCRRYKRTVVTQTGYRSTGWSYRQALTVDTTNYRMGTPVTIATDDDGVMAASTSLADPRMIAASANGATTISTQWNGCIEERDSSSTITGSSTSIPSSAFDLDINRIPTNDATRWRPMWIDMIYLRSAGSTSASSGTWMRDLDNNGTMDTNPAYRTYYACPTESRRMQVWANRTDMQNYVNSLVPEGYTYHDIGMIWGARLLSNGGIFAADNPDTFNAMPVSRSIIFMTDGDMHPECFNYSSYGVEQHDVRVTGSSSCTDQLNRHLARFRLACNAARGMGYSIWVIAFGTALTQPMIDCASNANQASVATDSATLIARFRQIGSNIGALRLTQ